jgi:riboflavin synthase
MFTGLVEEMGNVKEKIKTGDGIRFRIKAAKVLDDLKIGDSVAVNGCCLTVVERDADYFGVDTIEETLKKTNLGALSEGSFINLERPLKVDDRLGGHFVLGHVDTTGVVTDIKTLSNSHFMTVEFGKEFRKNLIYVGSVAIDGVSMTVAEVTDTTFGVGIIPHTWDVTVFGKKKLGDTVNLEFDVLGKYVERIMEANPQSFRLP